VRAHTFGRSGAATLTTTTELGDAREALIGVWRFLSYEDRDVIDDPWVQTFEDAPRGVILYHASGLLSVQVAAAPSDDAAPWSYVGYLGTFEVRKRSDQVRSSPESCCRARARLPGSGS